MRGRMCDVPIRLQQHHVRRCALRGIGLRHRVARVQRRVHAGEYLELRNVLRSLCERNHGSLRNRQVLCAHR